MRELYCVCAIGHWWPHPRRCVLFEPVKDHVTVGTGRDARGPIVEVDASGHDVNEVTAAVVEALSELRDDPATAVWVDHPSTALDEAMTDIGLAPARDLYIMDVHLPLTAQSSITTRPFEPGVDESAWVSVNNRAFASHREQSGWTLGDIQDRMNESWFDPAGFLIHEVDGQILGFCWTKIHADLDPPSGEIYVIAIDPDGQGRGLGRALTMAGLESIHSRGLTRGFLYVDADNAKAVSLYVDLGFKIETIRRLYKGTSDT